MEFTVKTLENKHRTRKEDHEKKQNKQQRHLRRTRVFYLDISSAVVSQFWSRIDSYEGRYWETNV